MPSDALYVEEKSLSVAWAKAFSRLTERGVRSIQPLVVSVTGFEDGLPIENLEIHMVLDRKLARNPRPRPSCATTANTIFPRSMWNRRKPARDLFRRYLDIYPRIRRLSRANSHGTYFERLIAFGEDDDRVNQLEHIINTYRGGNHRRSALQAAIFDPKRDHRDQRRRGFPCLQQVTFATEGDNGLSVTGFYDLQYLFDRGYGNYLGLCWLGRFMAHYLRRELHRMTCVSSIAELGEINVCDARRLVLVLERAITREA